MTPQRHARITAVLDRRQPDLTVLLEQVHKPHNLAAIRRSCDAVGILDAHAVAPRARLRRNDQAASGSGKWVRVHTHPSTGAACRHLREQGFRILAAHLSGRSLDFREADYTRPVAILMGTEKHGVSDRALELCDAEIGIPMAGMVPSLNVSVATAVILYEAQRQREAAGLYDRPRLAPERYRELLFRWGYPRLARRYEALGLPFPQIGEEGEILDPVPERVRRRAPVHS